MHCCKLLCGLVLTATGIIILGASLFAHFWIPTFVKDVIKETVSVTGPTAPGYKAFRNATEVIDLYEAYYMFNVDNADNVSSGQESQVHVTQKGPYTFKLNKYKPEANTSWRTDGTVQYMSQTEYEFMPGMSGDDFDEPMTTYRMALFGGIKHLVNANQSDFMTKFEIDMFNECLCGKFKCESWQHTEIHYGPFVTITPREFLLGFEDQMVACATKKLFGQLNPWTAALSHPNNSSDSKALSGVYSGGKYSDKVKNPPPANSMNEMAMYLGMTELPYWDTPYANKLNGSGGDSMIPGTAKVGHEAYIFVSDFLRSVTVVGVEDTKLHGVDLVRYTLHKSSLENAEQNPNNKAFHITTEGVQPAPTTVELPVYFSKPYYLNGNTTDISVTFHGAGKDLLDQNPNSYNVYLDFEPHTGALLRVNKRIQASVKLEPHALFPSTKKWPTTYAPVFWVDEYYTMSKEKVDDLKSMLFVPLALAKFGGIIGSILGAIVMLIGLVCCRSGCATSNDDDDDGSGTGGRLYRDPKDANSEKMPLNVGDSFEKDHGATRPSNNV